MICFELDRGRKYCYLVTGRGSEGISIGSKFSHRVDFKPPRLRVRNGWRGQFGARALSGVFLCPMRSWVLCRRLILICGAGIHTRSNVG